MHQGHICEYVATEMDLDLKVPGVEGTFGMGIPEGECWRCYLLLVIKEWAEEMVAELDINDAIDSLNGGMEPVRFKGRS